MKQLSKITVLLAISLGVCVGIIASGHFHASGDATQLTKTLPPTEFYAGPDWLQYLRPWAELLYFASSGLLVLVAAYGAQQIILLKRDIETRNLRASKELTVQCCERFAAFVLLRRKFLRDCEKAELPNYKGSVGNFGITTIEDKWVEMASAKMKLDSSIACLNQFELIAMTILSGSADDQLAFKTIGRAFCAIVATHYDIFTVRCPGQFKNVRELYGIWGARLSLEEFTAAKESLEVQIKSTPDRQIPVIGVNH